LFHVWGIGMRPGERDLGKALSYFQQGTPGGIEGCASRMKHVCEACVFVMFVLMSLTMDDFIIDTLHIEEKGKR
jgi:hypothetical protein